MVLAYCQFRKGIMGNFPTVLTPAEYAAYRALANRHGCDVAIRFAEAMDTLSDDSWSISVRGEAQSLIKALVRQGVVQHNTFTEMVRIVRVQTNASAPAPPDAIPLNLPSFITQLSLSRARAVWEMFELHALSGNGALPPLLAEHVIRRLRDLYRDDTDILKNSPQVRQLIYRLREYGFLEDMDSRGVYRISAKGLKLKEMVRAKIALPTP